MQDREVMYFLQTTNGIGKKTIHRLWDYFGSGDAIYGALEKELEQLLQPSQLRTILRDREKRCPADELCKLKQRGISYYSIWDEEYPKRLCMIEDRPNGLFVRGSLPKEGELIVSIIGTRKHSYYGEKYTKQFAELFACKGIPIVSGMARGIDGIAQQTAIACGGRTYAVLGCGVDICYPQEHKRLYNQIPFCGGIISEYPPGTMPAPGLFPMRNRIISALCDVLFVMEAREKSGTLITVDMALEQGKEVWVLPGRVDDVLSKGCNRLISQGAGMLPEAEEFLEELNGMCLKYGGSREQHRTSSREVKDSNEKSLSTQNKLVIEADKRGKDQALGMLDGLSELEREVIAVLDYQPLSLTGIYEEVNLHRDDNIWKDTNSKKPEKGISEDLEKEMVNQLEESKDTIPYSLQQVSNALIGLCMKKLAKQLSGNYYIRR